jgi:hypothetical protein
MAILLSFGDFIDDPNIARGFSELVYVHNLLIPQFAIHREKHTASSCRMPYIIIITESAAFVNTAGGYI